MNSFLKNLEITFRRDPTNFRPRINKKESTKDREQKLAGTYYYRERCRGAAPAVHDGRVVVALAAQRWPVKGCGRIGLAGGAVRGWWAFPHSVGC
jgi:hypothetical protein